MKLTRWVRHCIKKICSRRINGGAQMFVLCFIALIGFLVLFRVLFDYKKMHITHDMVEDALVTSLVSACVYNTDERAVSGAMVIYDSVTPAIEPSYILSRITGEPIYNPDPHDTLNDSALYEPTGDSYLNNAYDKFVKNLRQNLKLDATMNATTSGIEGEVVITDFSVYNKFYNIDETGAKTDFRFVRYTFVSGGGWSAYPFSMNQTPQCYNSFNHSMYTVVETSVSANISFTFVNGTKTDYAVGLTEDDYKTAIEYQRVVDITETY